MNATENEILQLIDFGRILAVRPSRDLDLTEVGPKTSELSGLNLYRAVALVRVALRRKDTALGELARAATLLLGLPDAGLVARLATTAEDGCAA